VVSFWTLVGQYSIAWVRLWPPQSQNLDRDPSAKPTLDRLLCCSKRLAGSTCALKYVSLVVHAHAHARGRQRVNDVRGRHSRFSAQLAQQCRTHSLQIKRRTCVSARGHRLQTERNVRDCARVSISKGGLGARGWRCKQSGEGAC
jgi:hypothetical protein